MIEYRSYAAAVAANEADPHDWRSTPMRTLAKHIEHALAEEEIADP